MDQTFWSVPPLNSETMDTFYITYYSLHEINPL